MKKIVSLVVILISQVFFASENGQCANIKLVESGKGDLCLTAGCEYH